MIGSETLQIWTLIIKMILACALVVALAILILRKVLPHLLKSHTQGSSAFKVLEIKPLTSKSALYLVDIEGQRVALGVTEQSVAKIMDLEPLSKESL